MPFKELTTKNFLGRNEELEGLQGLAAEAATGDANSILLYGRRGVGKTELLKHVYNRLFNLQRDAIPFFYTVKTYATLEDFSRDYLRSFILQCLAFLDKDASLIYNGIYSLRDLRSLAEKRGLQWAADIIDRFMKLKEEGETVRMFSSALNAPYTSFMNSGTAVVSIIDDFHKIKNLFDHNTEGASGNLWMYLERPVSSHNTPHIISGSRFELQNIFHEESSTGSRFEQMNLQGLETHESLLLFKLLGDMLNVNIELDMTQKISMFNGNPFYLKSFMQTARHTCRTLTEDDFWKVYMKEVETGNIATYWTSQLKSSISQFELRKPSLQLLYSMCSRDSAPDFLALSEKLAIESEKLDSIMHMLEASGTIETGFSTIGMVNDKLLTDVIKVLYYKEVEMKPVSSIRELILKRQPDRPRVVSIPSFDLSIPANSGAESVAVNLLKQAALHYNIPSEITGKLQVAMAELFAGVLENKQVFADRYDLKFICAEGIFSIEIADLLVDRKTLENESGRVRIYLDDMKFEKTMNGTRIQMIKKINKDVVSVP